MAYNGPQRKRPQNLGQNRNVQMRNNARRPNPFGQEVHQGGIAQGGPGQGGMQCPVGLEPGPGPDGRITCVPSKKYKEGI